MSVLDSLAYWMGSPGNSELSDLDATWSPSSHSNYSDQENSMQGSYTGGDSQQQQQLSSSGCSSSGTSPNSSFSAPGSGPAFTIGSSGPPPGEKQHRRGRGVKRVHQRQAANQRERKRMKTINDAFEGLRVRIPMAVADRKLSKVDTLRMAIGYIQQLSELVDSCNSQSGHFPGKAGPENTKVIIRYHNNQGYPEYDENMYGMQQQQQYPPLYGHSLSWENENEAKPSPDNKMSAKVWMPQQASQDDLSHLNALS